MSRYRFYYAITPRPPDVISSRQLTHGENMHDGDFAVKLNWVLAVSGFISKIAGEFTKFTTR